MATSTLSQISSALTTLHLPSFSPSFLLPILSSSSSALRQPPLASLVATAKLRALSSDICSSPSIILPNTPSLPPTLTSVNIQATILHDDIFVQVLDIEDLGRSKWEQIEALESERNGELKKGREIIRLLPAEDADPSSAATQAQPNTQASAAQGVSKGPFKLLLQDHAGTKIYAFELKKVEKIGLPPVMSIGCKLLLRKGCKVARGMILLEPKTVLVFGGKIEGLDIVWSDGREVRLRREVEADAARDRNR